MPKVNYSSRYTENPPRLDRWDGLFLFLDAIFIVMTMISNVENRVETYMTYLNFLRRTFQFPCSLFYSKKLQLF
ncbi:hypothetical protein B7724_02710 [Streptococcus oralis subsp. tigurinus]|nr:hypothetical protein B7730_06035 [Streptococcus oralis subsp. tigurinus]ORO49173.1 hypothetical protein B7724_02710 [Streptococcus oralis subsp. tigurinus]